MNGSRIARRDHGFPGAEEWVPDSGGLDAIRAAARDCRGCELWEPATQVVVSAGTASARIALVGEAPGDREDREGVPFVGPAGRLLDEALAAAHIERQEAYVTNAVKHFRFEERGKRRLHKTPDVGHMDACRPWLAAELAAVHPEVIVAMGATAARSVIGRPVKVGESRGRLEEGVVVTVHPSSVLRLRGRVGFDEVFDGFVRDLAVAARALHD